MWSKPVGNLPDEASRRKEHMPVKKFLDEVMTHTSKIEQVFWHDDYASVVSARNSLARCIKTQGYPIEVHIRRNFLYLERRDI